MTPSPSSDRLDIEEFLLRSSSLLRYMVVPSLCECASKDMLGGIAEDISSVNGLQVMLAAEGIRPQDYAAMDAEIQSQSENNV